MRLPISLLLTLASRMTSESFTSWTGVKLMLIKPQADSAGVSNRLRRVVRHIPRQLVII